MIHHLQLNQQKLSKIEKFYNYAHSIQIQCFKEARNSFFGLGVYLLKSKFRIEDKLRFP